MSRRINVGLTNLEILTGKVDISDWDDEELLRGQKRDRNGHFTGRPPRIVPTALYQELVRRQLTEANQTLLMNTHLAVQRLVAIVENPKTEDRDRLKAIEMVLNRVLGKEPIKVELHAKLDQPLKPWEELVARHYRQELEQGLDPGRQITHVTTDRRLPDDDDVIDADIVCPPPKDAVPDDAAVPRPKGGYLG